VVEATLGIWIVTLVGGAYLWSFTTGVGRPESNARASELPAWALFVHPVLALSGLGIWIGYLFTGGDVVPWVAFGWLVLTAAVGFLMAGRTLHGRRSRGGRPATERAATHPGLDPADVRYAEDQMPAPVIAGHGLLAFATMAMVLLVALGVGV